MRVLQAPSQWPPWAVMWLLASCICATCKWLTWHCADARVPPGSMPPTCWRGPAWTPAPPLVEGTEVHRLLRTAIRSDVVRAIRAGQRLGLGHGWRGWSSTMLALAVPVYWAVPSALRRSRDRALHAGSERDMTADPMAQLIVASGIAQLYVLVASALVPSRLNWREQLQCLSRLHRQMYWVYGGYVVFSIVAFALLSLLNARELAAAAPLRAVCAGTSRCSGASGCCCRACSMSANSSPRGGSEPVITR